MGEDLVQILDRCLHGGRQECWELFVACAQPLIASSLQRALSRARFVDRHLVDDLIQETFLKLWAHDFRALRNFRGGQDPFALQAYLRTVAASTALDHFRTQAAQKRPRVSVSLDDVVQAASENLLEEKIGRKMLLERVNNCLSKQKDRDRRIFWLYHRHGFTPKAISELPGIGIGAGGVETLLYRLTGLVRDCLRKSGVLPQAAFREGGRS